MKDHRVQKAIDELLKIEGIDFIVALIEFLHKYRFKVEDVLTYWGERKYNLLGGGFTVVPFDSRFGSIQVACGPAKRDVSSRVRYISFGGLNERYNCGEMCKIFGPFRVAYNPRDDYSLFTFEQLPPEIKANQVTIDKYGAEYRTESDILLHRNGREFEVVDITNFDFSNFSLSI